MLSVLMNLLNSCMGYISGPLMSFVTNTVLPFIKKSWKWLLPIVVVIGLVVYFEWQLKSKNAEIQSWQNKFSDLQKIEQVDKSTFEKQAMELDKITVDNAELKKTLDKSKRTIKVYEGLLFEWKARFDSVSTLPPDTVYKDKPGMPSDSTDRVFNKSVDNEMFIKGWFQTKSPYLLFINELKWLAKVDITLSQNSDGVWFTDLTTNSKYLKPTAINVSLVPFPVKWEYFYGGDTNFQSGLNFVGAEIIGGIKRGNWGVYTGLQYIDFSTKSGLMYKLGIIKIGAF